MKLDDVRKLTKFTHTQSEADHRQLQRQLLEIGIDPTNLYQELEMSSPYINTHRDTSYSNSTISLHSHNYFELLYCRVSDGVEYLLGSHRYRMQKGDILFVPPGVSHRPILPERMDEPYVRDVLWISSEFMDSLKMIFPVEDMKDLDWNLPIRTGGTRWEFLGELFHNGVQEEEARRPGWETVVVGNTLLILTNLARAMMERSTATMKAEKPELLDRIAAYIEGNFAGHITIGDLARQFYVSESTISHLFRQKMGVSVYRYITQRRLIAAKTRIQQGMLLEDVSRAVGFSDYSTFYRAFRQEFGISPRQFAQM